MAAPCDSKQRATTVALAAAAGGLGGFLLSQYIGYIWPTSGEKALKRVLHRIDDSNAKQIKQPEDALSVQAYSLEVERWVANLTGGTHCSLSVSHSLRIAAQALYLNRNAVPRGGYSRNKQGYLEWRAAASKPSSEKLALLCRAAGVDAAVAKKACCLVGKGLPLDSDYEMQVIEDAACLVFLESELDSFQSGEDDRSVLNVLIQILKTMSPRAHLKALNFQYSPRVLGCLIQAVGYVNKNVLAGKEPPMVAPRLPGDTVNLLRGSWKAVKQDQFCKDFMDQLFESDQSLKLVFDSYPAASPQNIIKVISLLLDLLDAEDVPRLEQIVRSLGGLARESGNLRMHHLAPIKHALVRAVSSHASPKDKRSVSRAWEAFFFALTAVAAPYLVLADSVKDATAATASTLPTPAAGPQAGAIAAHGAALLEMTLGISAITEGRLKVADEVLLKIREARGWLVDAVRDDVNAYCGLLSSVYAVPSQSSGFRKDAEEAERRRWLRRATEVPLRIAEMSLAAAVACKPYAKSIKLALQNDWIAGVRLLHTAMTISVKNAEDLMVLITKDKATSDIEARLAHLREEEQPWETLYNV